MFSTTRFRICSHLSYKSYRRSN